MIKLLSFFNNKNNKLLQFLLSIDTLIIYIEHSLCGHLIDLLNAKRIKNISGYTYRNENINNIIMYVYTSYIAFMNILCSDCYHTNGIMKTQRARAERFLWSPT